MLLLLPANPKSYRTPPPTDLTGWLVTPQKRHVTSDPTLLTRYQWAADNCCFTQGANFRIEQYEALLRQWALYRPNCLFATVPDVVADAKATHERWLKYAPQLAELGYPLAYVAQDGLEHLPKADFKCLFIGGSTEWKLGQIAARLIREAKEAGLWVHMGRVNSRIRMLHAHKLGVDSIDGTGWAHAPNDNMKWALPHLRWQQGQLSMFQAA